MALEGPFFLNLVKPKLESFTSVDPFQERLRFGKIP